MVQSVKSAGDGAASANASDQTEPRARRNGAATRARNVAPPLPVDAAPLRPVAARALPLAAQQSIESDLLALDYGLKFLGEVLPARGLSDAQAQAWKVRQPIGRAIDRCQAADGGGARTHGLLRVDIDEIDQLLQEFADQIASVDVPGYHAASALQRLVERASRTLSDEDSSPDGDLAAPAAADSRAGCLLNSVAVLCDQVSELASNLIADMGDDQALMVAQLVAIRELAGIGGLKADATARLLGLSVIRGDAASDWLFAPGEGGIQHG